MKKHTYANKLAAILGIEDKVDTTIYADKPQKGKVKKLGPPEGEVQNFRQAQAITYFLQAPELFSKAKCKHCGEEYLVSRHQVAYCSYTCIEKELEKQGIKWSRAGEYEILAKEVYDGNEPMWIRNIEFIRELVAQFTVEEDQSLVGV